MLGAEFARQAGDVHAVVVIKHGEIVVDDLHGHVRGVAEQKAGVHRVVGVHVTTALELELCPIQSHACSDLLHGASRPRHRQAHVVTVGRSDAPRQGLVAGVADESQARPCAIRNITEGSLELAGEIRRNDRIAIDELQVVPAAPGRIVDPDQGFGTGVFGTKLRLVRQVLQRIVIPELDFDPAIQRTAGRRLVGAQRSDGAVTIAFYSGRGQSHLVLDDQRDATCHGLRQPEIGAVDALGASRQRCVIRVANKLDHQVLLAGKSLPALAHAFDERGIHVNGLFIVVDRRNDVLDPGTLGVAFNVAQLTHRLHAADLHPLDLMGDEELFKGDGIDHLVVPDLDIDATVKRSPGGGVVAGDRLGIARPIVGDSIRRQRQQSLQVLGRLAGAFARKTEVIAIDGLQARRQALRISVTDQVDAHVDAVVHAVEYALELDDGLVRNLRDTRFEIDRGHKVGELDRFVSLGGDFAGFYPVAEFRIDVLRVLDPLHQRRIR